MCKSLRIVAKGKVDIVIVISSVLAGGVGLIVIVTCEAGTDALACRAGALQRLKLVEMYSWLSKLAARHKFMSSWVCC